MIQPFQTNIDYIQYINNYSNRDIKSPSEVWETEDIDELLSEKYTHGFLLPLIIKLDILCFKTRLTFSNWALLLMVAEKYDCYFKDLESADIMKVWDKK